MEKNKPMMPDFTKAISGLRSGQITAKKRDILNINNRLHELSAILEAMETRIAVLEEKAKRKPRAKKVVPE